MSTTEPIRVLQVIGKMNMGGAETMVMNLYRKIDRTKIQFDFLVHTTEKCYYDDEILSLGGRIYRIKRFTGTNAISYYRDCINFFRNHKYSIVHGQIGSCAALYLLAAKKNGAFTIAHSHSALIKKHSLHDYAYSVFSYPTRYIADQLFGCSLQAGITRYGRKATESNRYKTFYNGIDISSFSFSPDRRFKAREKLGISLNQTVIISVGRISAPKNPLKIYEIYSCITENCNNVTCLWAGTGEFFEEFKNRIESNHQSKHIKMLGVRDDIPDLLQAADCFLFPSIWEGLPISVVEAQASCLPCIISDVVTDEVAITNLVHKLSIDVASTQWAEQCMTYANEYKSSRHDISDEIKKAGYDIDDTTKWLTEFYLLKAKAK